MAASSVYQDAFDAFKVQMQQDLQTAKERGFFDDFLRTHDDPEGAMDEARSLKNQSDKKWGDRKVGKLTVSARWINSIMENIQIVIKAGDHVTQEAPQCVGLAWLAVRLTLSAIRGNHELYTLFGTGLTDITDFMVLVLHYEELYSEGPKKAWKKDKVVGQLVSHIKETYISILRFSFEIKRHIQASPLTKVGHAVADYFGTSSLKFRDLLESITTHKTRVIEYSQAAYQSKSLEFNSSQEVALKSLADKLQDMKESREKFMAEFLAMKQVVEATTKPTTDWDFAARDFERTKKKLGPDDNYQKPLIAAIGRRFPNTCQWILGNPEFVDWRQAKSNQMLCISGEQGTGKSTLLAHMVEYLCDSLDKEDTILVYFSCETSADARAICNNLLYQAYSQAINEGDHVLLEACNRIFSYSKARLNVNARSDKPVAKGGGDIAEIFRKEDSLPDLPFAMPRLSTQLKRSIIIVLDAVDLLPGNEGRDLADQIHGTLKTNEEAESSGVYVKVLAACRAGFPYGSSTLRLTYATVNIEESSRDDMRTLLSTTLKDLPLSADEQEKAVDDILEKSGSSFSYITETGIPFISKPFRGSIDKRLEMLPRSEGMSGAYESALRKMEPNYVDLLRVAVTWCLLGIQASPITVELVMDVYRSTYRADNLDERTREGESNHESFPLASHTEITQIEDAKGPFLELEPAEKSPTNIYLRNLDEVKRFCLESAGHERRQSQHDDEPICSRCGVAISESKHLAVSEKEGHLDLALSCLRHLNNTLFQKRARLLVAEDSKSGIRSPEDETAEPQAQPVADTTEMDGASDTVGEDKSSDENSGETEAIEVEDDQKQDKKASAASHGSDECADDETRETEVTEGQDAQEHDNKPDGDDYDDEESADEGDDAETTASDDGTDDDAVLRQYRNNRYEVFSWPYHLRKAEDLWSEDERSQSDEWTEIFTLLDSLCANTAVFNAWQRAYSCEASAYFLKSPRKPLHVAAYLGLTSWAKQLLDQGHDPNELSGSSNAVQAAAEAANRPTMLKLLLERGADINAESADEAPAFHSWLCQDPSVEAVELMLKHGADPVKPNKISDFSALHYVAWAAKEPESLNLIMKQDSAGASPDINCKTKDLFTPLHTLLWRQEVPYELLEAILDLGADVNQDDRNSQRPLQKACMWGDVKCLEILLSRNALVDDDDTSGATALHYAARFGNKDCVDILLRHGADITRTDKNDKNLLFYACLGGSQDKAEWVLDRLLAEKMTLSEINKPAKGLKTPLRQAAYRGFGKVVQRLIAAAKEGDDIASLRLDLKDTKYGMTALHRAAWNGHSDCVRALLGAGADAKIPVKDQKGRTALVLAHERWDLGGPGSYEDAILHLVEADPQEAMADVKLLCLCATNGSTRLIQQLQSIGADFSLPDQYGWTPLELARKFQKVEVERILKRHLPLPSRWERNGLRNSISQNGLDITHTSRARRCVTTDRPLPAGLDDFYFEITLESLEGAGQPPDYPEVAIGFCTLRGHTIEFPGWPPTEHAKSAVSWGYHGDNGGFYSSAGDGLAAYEDSSLQYRLGDTVGCGVNLMSGKIWFTKNGKLLNHSFSDGHGRLFPVVGLKDPVRFTTTFVGPFKYNSET